MKNLYENQKIELMALLRREMNGAVVDGMKMYDSSSTLNSYGVSIPTIKSICSGFSSSQGLSLHLYKSKVRELKLCAIFLADPTQISTEQIEQWSENFGSYEIMIHLSALFAKSPLITPFIAPFLESNNHLKVSLALLVISKSELNAKSSQIYANLLIQSLPMLSSKTLNGFVVASVAIYNHFPPLKEQLEKQGGMAAQEIAPFLY